MTDKQFNGYTAKRLRALEKAATKRPWNKHSSNMLISSALDPCVILVVHHQDPQMQGGQISRGEAKANRSFVAASRNALPSLLDEIERLEGENKNLTVLAERRRLELLNMLTERDDLKQRLDDALKAGREMWEELVMNRTQFEHVLAFCDLDNLEDGLIESAVDSKTVDKHRALFSQGHAAACDVRKGGECCCVRQLKEGDDESNTFM